MDKILILGGAGYVGVELVYELIKKGFKVGVLDLFLYKKDLFKDIEKKIEIFKEDIRNLDKVEKIVSSYDKIIHLSCISNDPGYELNPKISKKINYESFISLVDICNKKKIKQFIYASSSSVYGIKNEKNVSEDLKLEPLTDYSKYKVLCEKKLLDDANFNFTIIRPATVCGFSRKLRLDLSVNILSSHGFFNKKIKVFGGKQLRPNINIKDMVNAYVYLLDYNLDKINRKIYNVGYENLAIEEIAKKVKKYLPHETEIEFVKTNDNRSYHVSSKKIEEEINFKPKYTIDDAIKELIEKFKTTKLKDPFNNPEYHNLKELKKNTIFN